MVHRDSELSAVPAAQSVPGPGGHGQIADRPILPLWAEIGLLLIILAGAAALRLLLIGHAPAGPHHDEAANILDALDVLAGRFRVFSPRSYGREMLAMYLAAPLVALLGPDRLAVRLPTAVAGVLTILATWALAREMFRQESRRLAQIAGLLAALFLSLSFWLLVLNRIGLRANYLPLTEVVCFLFLWRALRTNRLREYAASGFFLGLAMHTYISARFVPISLALFFGLLMMTRTGRALILPRWRGWLLLAGVALLVFGPLLAFFLTHPASFLERAGQVSIFSPKLHHGDPLGLWVRSLAGNLGVFGFTGDHNPLYNLPGRPGLDPVQAVLFWIGVAVCVARWRRPSYAFLAVWWLAMLLPSILAPDPIPHYLRAIGTLPAAAVIAARPLAGVLASPPRLPERVVLRILREFAVRGRARRLAPTELHSLRTTAPAGLRLAPRRVALGLLAGLIIYVALAGYNVAHSYFSVWLARDDVYYAYYGHLADLAAHINADPDPQAVYLFPVNYDRRLDTYNAYTLEILYRGPTPFHYIRVDDATVARDLAAMTAGKQHVNVVVWTNGEHIDADPRQMLPFYLERFGQKTGERWMRGYQVWSYELPPEPVDFGAALDWQPASADYGALRLAGQARAGAAPSGEAAWVALRWRVAGPVGADLRVSLRLDDAAGHRIGQLDGTLMDNAHRASAAWQAGDEIVTYHLVPVLPGTLPGASSLSLVLYEAESLRPIMQVGRDPAVHGALMLGPLAVQAPVRGAGAEPEVGVPMIRLARGLELVGYGSERDSARPGEALSLALYWHARRDIARDQTIIVGLLNEAGETAAEWARAPSWPTSQWQAGQVWRDWHDLTIPAGTPPGTYRIVIRVQDTDLPGKPSAILGEIEIGH